MESKMPFDQSTQYENESDELLSVSRRIREMPYLQPPETLLPSIMAAVKQKRFPVWYRALRWARSPRSITFTPLQAAYLASALVLFSLVGALYLVKGDQRSLSGSAFQDRLPVTLALNVPEAQTVAVVGTFNGWHGKGYEMRWDQTRGAWTLVLQLPAGRYEYAFLLDDEKLIPDPGAGFYQDDGFGNQNAVLIVGNQNEKAI
jgi:hypothetical protein